MYSKKKFEQTIRGDLVSSEDQKYEIHREDLRIEDPDDCWSNNLEHNFNTDHFKEGSNPGDPQTEELI